MRSDVRRAVARALSAGVTSARRLGGGSINDAFTVRLDDGRDIFVKMNASADRRMFPREARGLAWLADAHAIAVPKVLAVSDEAGQAPAFLALELVTPAPRAPDFDEQLGHDLAALHASGADRFGLSYDNFIGTLAQRNAPCATWAEFYVTRRLEPQLRLAVDRRTAPASWTGMLTRLSAQVPDLVGPDEPPARLHGDLWSGNLHTDARGGPCLIDPAAYGGHREIDLAMLALFGNPGPRFLDAYDDRYPLAPGARERIPLYQLYPLLVHVNLFGGSYVDAAARAMSHYV